MLFPPLCLTLQNQPFLTQFYFFLFLQNFLSEKFFLHKFFCLFPFLTFFLLTSWYSWGGHRHSYGHISCEHSQPPRLLPLTFSLITDFVQMNSNCLDHYDSAMFIHWWDKWYSMTIFLFLYSFCLFFLELKITSLFKK